GFWAEAAPNVVVVEADTFKETNVIYRDLSSKGHHNDMLQAAELSRELASIDVVLATTEKIETIRERLKATQDRVKERDELVCLAATRDEEPVEILEREFNKLKRSRIAIVKVRWNSKRSPEFTWERED
ncbi:hypothetical protein Tco_0748014, partial [Tanacetum coccineum]